MGDLVQFPQPTKDGGKDRFKRTLAEQRSARLSGNKPIAEYVDDLVMLRPDPELPCDCA